MRFRRLTLNELKELHKEFIQFLSSNTITGDDWKKIKADNYEKAEKLIDIFSDIVLEKSISNIKYLEKREPNSVLFFCFHSKEVLLIGVSTLDKTIDFTNDTVIASLANGNIKTEISTFKTAKPILGNREDEMFKMLEDGCLVSDGKIFKKLSKIN